jgi:hypothetical protein
MKLIIRLDTGILSRVLQSHVHAHIVRLLRPCSVISPRHQPKQGNQHRNTQRPRRTRHLHTRTMPIQKAALLSKRHVLGDTLVPALAARDVQVREVLRRAVEKVSVLVDVLELFSRVWDLVVRVGGGGVADEDAPDLGGELLGDLRVGGEQGGRGCVADKDCKEQIYQRLVLHK